MDFRLSEEERALKQGVRSFLQEKAPLDAFRRLEAGGALDRATWSSLAEMGVFASRLPEDRGGAGFGASGAILVFEELGRKMVPGPLIFTHLAAALVEGAATGETIVTGLDLPERGGAPVLIEHLASADLLLLLRKDGIERLEPRTLEALPIETPLDPLTPIHAVERLPRGERIGTAEDADRLRLEGTLLASAALLGIATAVQELATSYAKERTQFDRPIGSFQAVKHLLADMFVRQELARAQVYAAGATLDHPSVGDGPRAVSGARIIAAEAAIKNARAAIQVHGGMGYTWEVPIHYHLKRAWVLDAMFGTSETHAEGIAARLSRDA